MSQNPTEKAPGRPDELGEAHAIEIKPRCPYCGRELPGLNILSMELPTPQGGMVWLLPSCPFVADENGKTVDGREPCGKIIGAQHVGYSAPRIATPGGGHPWQS